MPQFLPTSLHFSPFHSCVLVPKFAVLLPFRRWQHHTVKILKLFSILCITHDFVGDATVACVHALLVWFRRRCSDNTITVNGRRTFRSSDTATFVVPRTYTTFGDRSFAVAGARMWNSLPSSLRSADLSTERFKRALKTCLFV